MQLVSHFCTLGKYMIMVKVLFESPLRRFS